MKTRDLLDAQSLVVRPADHLDDRQTAGDADLFLRHKQPTGYVVAALAEVFAPGELNQFSDFFGSWKRLHVSVTPSASILCSVTIAGNELPRHRLVIHNRFRADTGACAAGVA